MRKKEIIERLENALDYANYTNARFGSTFQSSKITLNGPDQITEYIKTTTERYRKTWLIPQIEEALRLVREGK
jgi:hypothetical protein